MSIQSIPYCSSAVELRTMSSLFDAFKLMLGQHINHLPLCDEAGKDGELRGMLNRRPLLAHLVL